MTEGATQLGGGLPASKASASSADHKHQGCAQTERGNTRGVTSAHILAAHKPQDRSSLLPARAGFLSMIAYLLPVELAGLRGPVLFPNSHRLAALPRSRRRVVPTWSLLPCNGAARRLVPRCAGSNRARDLSAIGSGSRPAVGNTLADQQSVNAFADLPHLSIALSKSGSSAGFKTSWKDLTCEAEALSSDDKIHD